MPRQILSRSTSWKNILLVCGKCSRKLDGGFGPDGDATLRSALRKALKQAGRRRDVSILETRCMGICPKRAVTAINAGAPGRIFVIPGGTSAEAAIRQLTEPAD
jgi:predicted metal-binding protein